MVGLIVLFGFSVAVSLLWLGGVGFYVFAKIGFAQLFGLPVPEIAMIAATAFAPLAALWLVTGLLYNGLTLKKQGNTINLLLAQTRRSADHAEAMVRTLMEAQVQTRSATVLRNADLFINELNDLLSDILVRFGLLQPAHTELVWQRVGDGNRWAFCKVLLLNADNSPHFKEDLKNQLMRDEILSNAVRTFCYRFEQMFTMLERHDIEHYLTKIFEEGALGRVYLRFVEACREIDRPEPQAYAPLEPEQPQEDPVPDEQPAPEEEETYFPDPEPLPDPDTESDEVPPFGFLRPTR
mgnify:FL=1